MKDEQQLARQIQKGKVYKAWHKVQTQEQRYERD